jgi:hypothetical protein
MGTEHTTGFAETKGSFREDPSSDALELEAIQVVNQPAQSGGAAAIRGKDQAR